MDKRKIKRLKALTNEATAALAEVKAVRVERPISLEFAAENDTTSIAGMARFCFLVSLDVGHKRLSPVEAGQMIAGARGGMKGAEMVQRYGTAVGLGGPTRQLALN